MVFAVGLSGSFAEDLDGGQPRPYSRSPMINVVTPFLAYRRRRATAVRAIVRV